MSNKIIKENEDLSNVATIDSHDVINKAELVESNNSVVIDEASAKQLTMDIKSTSTALYVLLKRAHDSKAWVALGYKSWTEYIENEFEFSRTRSYQLINQANVIEVINEASGVEVYLTESEARSIKKRLPEITEKLRDVKDIDNENEALEKTKQIIEDSKDEIDNSSSYNEDDELSDDRKGFSKGGTDDGWDDPDDFESEVSTTTNFSSQIKFASERSLETLKVYQMFPNATEIGKYFKETGNEEEVLKLGRNAMQWLAKMMSEIERKGE